MNDAAAQGSAPPRLRPEHNLFLSVFPPIVLPVFLSAADATVVATALPAIATTFDEVDLLSWVVIANLIASTIAAPAYGRFGDMFGRRRMMVVALVLFMLAAVLCAVAPTFWALLGARVLQGLGGGGLMTMAQALIGEHVPPKRRGSYQGYLSANIVAGSTIGPVLGGFLTEAFGWRAIFLGYLPLGILALLLLRFLPRGAAASGRGSVDLPGMALLVAFIVPLLMAVSQLQKLNVTAIPLLVAALVVLPILLRQQRRAKMPLLALPLLRLPAFWRADVMAACSGASLTAMITFLPIYLQVVMGASAARSGVLLIPLTGAVSFGAVVTGWLISRSGRTAIFPTVGLTITAITLAGLAITGPYLSQTTLAWVLAAGGLCQGSSMITAQITVQTVCGPSNLGAAAGSVQLSRSLGSAFGAAMAGAVLFGLLTAIDGDTATMFADMVRRGPGAIAHLSVERRALVQAEIANAFRGLFVLVACFSCTIVAMAATLPMRRL